MCVWGGGADGGGGGGSVDFPPHTPGSSCVCGAGDTNVSEDICCRASEVLSELLIGAAHFLYDPLSTSAVIVLLHIGVQEFRFGKVQNRYILLRSGNMCPHAFE